jgi:phage terminase large subunit-like protein
MSDEKVTVGKPTILTPPQDGTSLDADDVFEVVRQYAARYPRCTFVLDPEAGGEQLAQRIEKELPDARVMTYSQKTTPMCAASQRLASLIAEGRIRHPADPELTRHVLSAAAKWVGEMWRLVKQKGKKLPIDGAIALAMACEVVESAEPEPRSVYAERAKMWREQGIIDDD